MSSVTRFSVSIDTELFERFSRMAKRHGYGNRSEALRDLIRDGLVRDEWKDNEEIVGTITLVYDHHTRDLSDRLNRIQHDFCQEILATMHLHLDHDNCLEVITVKGLARKVQKISETLIGTRGVKHGKLSATTTGKKI